MSGPETRGRAIEGQKNEFLSLGTQQPASSHSRSTSLAPSFCSGRSGITTVEDNSEFLDNKAAFKRQRTLVVDIKLSWWDLVKAFFIGPGKFGHKVASRITPEFEYPSPDKFDHDPSPFVVTVSVFPFDNPVPERHQHVRCTFDTGCVQGNIVSLDLARRLGYTEFETLKSREQNGGVTVMGDTLTPEGAVHLSWYHSTSAQVFKDMRFLVLANAKVDLLIGVHSIVKYNLISPPNFWTNADEGGLVIMKRGDKKLQDLKQRVADCKDRLENLQLERKPGHEDQKLKAKIKKAEKKHEIAEGECTLYEAQKTLEQRPGDKNLLKVIEDTRKRLDELNGKGGKTKAEKDKDKEDLTEKDSMSLHQAPSVQVEEPNGKVRTATGLSISGHIRPRK